MLEVFLGTFKGYQPNYFQLSSRECAQREALCFFVATGFIQAMIARLSLKQMAWNQ